MTFLRNKREYKKWAKEVNGGQPQAPIDPPEKLPCFAYTVCASYGYEEDAAKYLYVEDLQKMILQFYTIP